MQPKARAKSKSGVKHHESVTSVRNHSRVVHFPWRLSSLRERDDVRRSRARSLADSVAGPNAPKDDFTSSKPHRFRADAVGPSRAINHPQCAGKSLLPLINDVTALSNNVFLEWAPNRTKVKKGSRLARRRLIKRAVEESTRTVVSPHGWKLCLSDKDLNELYSLKDDPFETHNLHKDPGCAPIISRLAAEIHRWQDSTNDQLRL